MKVHFLLGMLFLTLLHNHAFSAQLGIIQALTATLYPEAKEEGSLAELNQGELLAISNQSIAGFYKVRTSDQKIGFIKAELISPIIEKQAQPPLTPETIPSPTAPLTVTATASTDVNLDANLKSKEVTQEGAQEPTQEFDKNLALTPPADPKTPPKCSRKHNAMFGDLNPERFKGSLFGGIQNFSTLKVVNRLSGLGVGFRVGGSLFWKWRAKWAVGVQFHSLFKNLILTDVGTGNTFQLNVSSLPLLAGVSYDLYQKPLWILRIKGMLGVGINTQIYSNDLTRIEPLTTGSILTGALAGAGEVSLSGEYEFLKRTSVYLEAGYMLINTPTIPIPSPAPNGALILPSKIQINMSGIFLSSGIHYRF